MVRGVTGDPDDDYLDGPGVIVSGDHHLLSLGTIRDGERNALARV